MGAGHLGALPCARTREAARPTVSRPRAPAPPPARPPAVRPPCGRRPQPAAGRSPRRLPGRLASPRGPSPLAAGPGLPGSRGPRESLPGAPGERAVLSPRGRAGEGRGAPRGASETFRRPVGDGGSPDGQQLLPTRERGRWLRGSGRCPPTRGVPGECGRPWQPPDPTPRGRRGALRRRGGGWGRGEEGAPTVGPRPARLPRPPPRGFVRSFGRRDLPRGVSANAHSGVFNGVEGASAFSPARARASAGPARGGCRRTGHRRAPRARPRTCLRTRLPESLYVHNLYVQNGLQNWPASRIALSGTGFQNPHSLQGRPSHAPPPRALLTSLCSWQLRFPVGSPYLRTHTGIGAGTPEPSQKLICYQAPLEFQPDSSARPRPWRCAQAGAAPRAPRVLPLPS